MIDLIVGCPRPESGIILSDTIPGGPARVGVPLVNERVATLEVTCHLNTEERVPTRCFQPFLFFIFLANIS